MPLYKTDALLNCKVSALIYVVPAFTHYKYFFYTTVIFFLRFWHEYALWRRPRLSMELHVSPQNLIAILYRKTETEIISVLFVLISNKNIR
jgi:hypothetical protein